LPNYGNVLNNIDVFTNYANPSSDSIFIWTLCGDLMEQDVLYLYFLIVLFYAFINLNILSNWIITNYLGYVERQDDDLLHIYIHRKQQLDVYLN
jgi:hypothetical protein